MTIGQNRPSLNVINAYLILMNTFLHGILVSTVTLASVLAPLSSASAARNFIQMQELQQQLEQSTKRTEDTQELLQLLDVSIDPNDPALNSQEFERVVDEYQKFKQSIGALGNQYVEVTDKLLEMMILSTQIDHPEFVDLMPSPEDIADIQEARDAIANESEHFEEEFTQFVIETLLDELAYSPNYDDDYYYDYNETDLWAWGYADPWSARPGEIVWLRDESDNPAGTDLTVTWTQIAGPDVLWLETDHPTDALFIAPQLIEGEEFMSLQFEMMVDNGIETDYYTVWVDVAEDSYWEYEDDFMASAITPTDPEVMEVLEMLWLELPENDPLYNDPNFETFVNAYTEFKREGTILLERFADVFDTLLNVALAASEVEQEDFQANFALTDDDRADIEQLRMELRQDIVSSEENIGEMMIFLLFAFREFTGIEDGLY